MEDETEEEKDIYVRPNRHKDNDEISCRENAFMSGYIGEDYTDDEVY